MIYFFAMNDQAYMLLYSARDFTMLPDGGMEKLQSQVKDSGKQHSFQIQVAADPAVLSVPLSVRFS